MFNYWGIATSCVPESTAPNRPPSLHMITEDVIKELFKNYKKPPKDQEELQLDHFAEVLQPHHKIEVEPDEVVVSNLDEFSPFRRFLRRSIHAVLEFDKNVAFVFRNHILFFSKVSDQLNIIFRPEEKVSLFDRIFGRSE